MSLSSRHTSPVFSVGSNIVFEQPLSCREIFAGVEPPYVDPRAFVGTVAMETIRPIWSEYTDDPANDRHEYRIPALDSKVSLNVTLLYQDEVQAAVYEHTDGFAPQYEIDARHADRRSRALRGIVQRYIKNYCRPGPLEVDMRTFGHLATVEQIDGRTSLVLQPEITPPRSKARYDEHLERMRERRSHLLNVVASELGYRVRNPADIGITLATLNSYPDERGMLDMLYKPTAHAINKRMEAVRAQALNLEEEDPSKPIQYTGGWAERPRIVDQPFLQPLALKEEVPTEDKPEEHERDIWAVDAIPIPTQQERATADQLPVTMNSRGMPWRKLVVHDH